MDEVVMVLYSKGMPTRDVQETIAGLCSIGVTPMPVSEVSEAMEADIRRWLERRVKSSFLYIVRSAS